MENAILFGNGLNRIGGNGISWEDLLKSLSSIENLPSNSNTLNYECIYLDTCNDGDSCEKEDSLGNEYALKKRIAEACSSFHSHSIYEELLKLPVDVFLTTNYDGVMDRTLEHAGYTLDKANSCVVESIYSIRRNHTFVSDTNGKSIKRVFPIHGEYAAPKTIMLGYDHYCGSLGKLDDFFKGKYVYIQDEHTVKLPRLLERLSNVTEKQYNVGAYWPDYFFTYNVHIIGLGLELVESDLWWVLDKRARYKQLNKNIVNHIYYYGTPNESISKLLDAFGVNVVRAKVRPSQDNAAWIEAYSWMLDEMRKKL